MFFINFVILSCSTYKDEQPIVPKTYVNISSFHILQTITDKLFNNPFKSYSSKESESLDQLQSIRNIFHSMINFIIQLLALILFMKFFPFNSLYDFKRYWRHTPIGTRCILISFIIIHIFSYLLDLIHPNFLLEIFSNIHYLVYEQKQYWRPFTSLFLHSDLFHLLTYCLLVFIYCPILEKYLGTSVFIFIIFVCPTFNIIYMIIYGKLFTTNHSDDFSTGFATIFLYDMLDIYIILAHQDKPQRMIPSNRLSPSPPPPKIYKGLDYTYHDIFKLNGNIFSPIIALFSCFLLPQTSKYECFLTFVTFLLRTLIPNGVQYNLNILSLINIVYPIIIVTYFIIYLIYF